MPKLIVYHAHPGPKHSHANRALAGAARRVEGIAVVDLYAEYPRFDIDIDREQARILDHEVILFQYPMFWYATPSILKEWLDLVLEHGFAYGTGGDRLQGKTLMLAVTAAGPEDAYAPDGYQRYPIRTFLTPLEQTAHLCGMRFGVPYVLFGALRAGADGRLDRHVAGYRRLLTAIRDGRHDFGGGGAEVLQFDSPSLVDQL